MCMPMSRNNRSWTCSGWEDTMDLKYHVDWYTTYLEFGGAIMLDLHFKKKMNVYSSSVRWH
jgi:hypothetical protein